MEFNEAVNTGIIDKSILSDKPKKVISGDIEEIKHFLRENYSYPVGYKGSINTTLKICHLWNTYFRLNYWGKKGKELIIIFSMFIKVDIDGDKYIVEHLNKNELRR